MKSTVTRPPQPVHQVTQGDLFEYVGPARSSVGEIVMALSEKVAVVIHSVSPEYPLGHQYVDFSGPGGPWNEWRPVSDVAITYSR